MSGFIRQVYQKDTLCIILSLLKTEKKNFFCILEIWNSTSWCTFRSALVWTFYLPHLKVSTAGYHSQWKSNCIYVSFPSPFLGFSLDIIWFLVQHCNNSNFVFRSPLAYVCVLQWHSKSTFQIYTLLFKIYKHMHFVFKIDTYTVHV